LLSIGVQAVGFGVDRNLRLCFQATCHIDQGFRDLDEMRLGEVRSGHEATIIPVGGKFASAGG
jgi:hypothetical protein